MTAAKTPRQVNEDKLRAISRDFRTDTITMPTDAMFDAMKDATRGDDVYAEDDATNELQDHVAKMAGFEAGLFCPSGTMTNQLAIRTWLMQPPHSVLLDARSHIHMYEAGGVAFHSQAESLAIPPRNGHHLTLEDVSANVVRGEDIHSAPTRIVALENTLSGTIFPQDEIIRISDAMRKEGIIMHCDGARMWEVSAATGMSMKELCQPFDSISLCLSKGLGAPIGSILLGPAAFIKKARHFRKLFGGGIRQCGSLSVAASYALEHHFPLLRQTHQLASRLATEFARLGVKLLLPSETNMVWIDTKPLGFSLDELAEYAQKTRGIRLGHNRIVCHIQTSPEAVEDLIAVVKELKERHADKADLSLVDEEQNARFGNGDWHGMRPVKIAQMGVDYGKSQRQTIK